MLTGRSRVASLIGWPVAHSLSPRLHGYWLSEHGIDGIYVPFPVRPGHFAEVLAALPKMGVVGGNITLPHKEAALAMVDEATPEAHRIGAVNTIVVDADGRMRGSNTDGYGFIENVRSTVPEWNAAAGPALVFGAGGAARAICVALLDEGVPRIFLANRNRERAESLANDLREGVSVVDWKNRSQVLGEVRLLVNTTTLGMVGNAPLELDMPAVAAGTIVCDIVYRPLMTPLLQAAKDRGLEIVDGLGMLLHQARPGFAAWFGVEPVVSPDLRRFVEEGLIERP